MLFKAMGITDQLVIAAKKQELVREVESTIPEYDALSNTYQVSRDGAVETYPTASRPSCSPLPKHPINPWWRRHRRWGTVLQNSLPTHKRASRRRRRSAIT